MARVTNIKVLKLLVDLHQGGITKHKSTWNHVELLLSLHFSFCPCRVRLKGPRKLHMAGKRNLQDYVPFAFCLGSVVALPSQKSGWVSLLSPLDVTLQSRAHEAALQILHWPPKASDRN